MGTRIFIPFGGTKAHAHSGRVRATQTLPHLSDHTIPALQHTRVKNCKTLALALT